MLSHIFRDMRVQFGTLLADIGLVDLPKRSRVSYFRWPPGVHQSLGEYLNSIMVDDLSKYKLNHPLNTISEPQAEKQSALTTKTAN